MGERDGPVRLLEATAVLAALLRDAKSRFSTERAISGRSVRRALSDLLWSGSIDSALR